MSTRPKRSGGHYVGAGHPERLRESLAETRRDPRHESYSP
jgi:hypothetical protein